MEIWGNFVRRCFRDENAVPMRKSVGFYVSFGEVSRMQDYFKSFWVVELPHFRKSGIANIKLLSALAVSANVQVIVCVKGNHTGYAASIINENGPKTVRNGVSIASCRRLKR